jgi:DNA-binding LacI/PurR family transcriptional regulator
MAKERIDLKAVAKATSVSIASVSNALLGKGRMSQATRQRICEAAREMGYTPDPIMRALCHYRSQTTQTKPELQTVALLVPEEVHLQGDKGAAVTRLMTGLQKAGAGMGISIELFLHDGTAATSRQLSRILYNRGIKGVILSFPRPYERDHPNELEWEKFAVVACNPLHAHDRFHSVGTDHFRDGRMLCRKLLELGHHRIGLCISEDYDMLSSRAFKAGIWTEMQKHLPSENQIPFLVLPKWEHESFRAWFEEWRPRVIISQRRELFVWLKQLGLRVPQDIGIAVPSTSKGFVNSGIDQNIAQMCQEALRLLWEKLIPTSSYGIPAFPLKITIPSSWNEGKTLLSPKGEQVPVE